MSEVDISDQTYEQSLPIAGLEFKANTFFSDKKNLGIAKLASSAGPLVSDFVTHQDNFKYDSYGIHVGQDDRLTFLGQSGKPIIGHFIDCRESSKTFGRRISAKYNPSPKRRLIIPCGIAHSFDNLEEIDTRDEPVWYSDFHNRDWDINNDLISIPRNVLSSDLPRVRPNSYRLPDQAHHLFSRIQQELLKEARRYAKRERLKPDSKEYIIAENQNWQDDIDGYNGLLTKNFSIAGVGFYKNGYALTGSRSYTVVPSTDACLADILILEPNSDNRPFWLHHRQQIMLSFLAPENKIVRIELCDLRQDKNRQVENIAFLCDPRVHLVIPQGVAYRISGQHTYYVRYETQLFVDEGDPRSDIPLIGRDTIELSRDQLLSYPSKKIPNIKCPAAALQLLAREEIKNFLHSQNFHGGNA